jgi:hypothetical protein
MASVKTEEKTHENLSKRQLLYNIRKYEIWTTKWYFRTFMKKIMNTEIV